MESAVPVKCECKFCGLNYPLSEGRLHGKKFTCHGCGTVDRQIRNNLGSGDCLRDMSVQDSKAFFQQIHQKKQEFADSRLSWQTLRGLLIQSLTEQRLTIFRTTVRGKELPLSVWVKMGWEESVVLGCPNHFCEDLKTQVYAVPVREISWEEEYKKIYSTVLQHEKEAHKKKGSSRKRKAGEAASSDGEVDLPTAAAGESQSKEAASSLTKRKKLLSQNTTLATRACKSLGSLQQSVTSFSKLVTKAEGSVEETLAEAAKKLLTQLESWSEACRHTINAHEVTRPLWDKEDGDLLPLPALPFEADDLKTALKQVSETGKALRAALPKKAKQDTASQGTEQKQEPKAAPKRRVRVKGQ